MRRFSLILVLALGSTVAISPAFGKGDTKAGGDAKKPTATKTATKKPPPPKKSVVVSAEHKKKLAELYGGFKFGMTKDEVVGALSKQLDERYEEKIKSTEDTSAKDRLRKEKKAELARVTASYTAFEGKKTGWDVSIIEDEFAHNTGEAMIERWENSGGKNQRRFFFFHDGKLWKMFISLDVSILPEDKKNFETFQSVMTGQYGPGDVEPGQVSWNAGDFTVHAIDKLRTYDALALVIEDPREKKELVALREAKAPPKADTSPVIKAVIDTDHTDHPDVKAGGSSAVDAVINAQGGTGTKPKKLFFDRKTLFVIFGR